VRVAIRAEPGAGVLRRFFFGLIRPRQTHKKKTGKKSAGKGLRHSETGAASILRIKKVQTGLNGVETGKRVTETKPAKWLHNGPCGSKPRETPTQWPEG